MKYPWFSFVSLAALWGASFLFMRLGAPEFGPVALSFGRVAIAAAVMLTIVFMRGMGRQLRESLAPTLMMGVINSAIPFALYSYAALNVSTGFNSILNATTAIWAGIIAAVWLGERMNSVRWCGVFLGFIGVCILFWDQASIIPGRTYAQFLLSGAAGLLAAIFYGYAANWSKSRLAGVPAMVNAAGSQLGASLALFPFAI